MNNGKNHKAKLKSEEILSFTLYITGIVSVQERCLHLITHTVS